MPSHNKPRRQQNISRAETPRDPRRDAPPERPGPLWADESGRRRRPGRAWAIRLSSGPDVPPQVRGPSGQAREWPYHGADPQASSLKAKIASGSGFVPRRRSSVAMRPPSIHSVRCESARHHPRDRRPRRPGASRRPARGPSRLHRSARAGNDRETAASGVPQMPHQLLHRSTLVGADPRSSGGKLLPGRCAHRTGRRDRGRRAAFHRQQTGGVRSIASPMGAAQPLLVAVDDAVRAMVELLEDEVIASLPAGLRPPRNISAK